MKKVYKQYLEKKYEVHVRGVFTILSKSQEDADRFIRDQLQDAVSSYTCALEVGDK